MKDEEMAEEYAKNHTHYEVGKRENGVEYAKQVSNVTIQQAFLDGLKLGRQDEQLTKAKELILKLYNAGRDVLMCRAEEEAYDNLSNAINDKSIEQFLKEIEK